MRNIVGAIRAGEYNMHFSSEKLRGEEKLLADELNALVTDFRESQNRQEALYGSYEAMLNQVNVALLAVNDDGEVLWMNDVAIRNLCGYRVETLSMLKAADPSLPKIMEQLHPGEQRLVSLTVKGHPEQLKIAMVHYLQAGESIRLYTIENVQQVVQQSETEAQRKLISVLTHEIMNSLSPIISLSETLSQTLKSGQDHNEDDNLLALEAISRRSRGLLSFVENYRTLSRVSAPVPSWVKIGDLFSGISSLMSNPDIRYVVDDPDLLLYIDRHQIEQVLINLLKNSIEACEATHTASITLRAQADHGNRHYLITVTDNGQGIAPEAIDNIFIPFFSTKPNGSGIGLSLSRQIVMNHGGTITASSSPSHTVFTVLLPLVYKV